MDESESDEKKGLVKNIYNIHGPAQFNQGPGHLKNVNEDRSVSASESVGAAATGDNHSGDMTTTQTETHQEEKPEAKQGETTAISRHAEPEDPVMEALDESPSGVCSQPDKNSRKTSAPTTPNIFKFDVVILCSRKLEDKTLAKKIQIEMSRVVLEGGKRLMVCLHDDPLFGRSISKRPEKIFRQSRFVFVMLTDHNDDGKYSDSIGNFVAAQPQDRPPCVFPLFIQDQCLYKGAIPDCLSDVEAVTWVDTHMQACKEALIELVSHDIEVSGSGTSAETAPTTMVLKGDTTSLRTDDLQTDADREQSTNSFQKCTGSHQLTAEEVDAVFTQGQLTRANKGSKPDEQSRTKVFMKDPDGNVMHVEVSGHYDKSHLMIGQHQTMNVSHYENPDRAEPSGVTKKEKKLPVTTSTAVPNIEAMKLVSSQIGKDWKKLGRELGFSDDDLDTVWLDFHNVGHAEVVYQMLRKWNEDAFPTSLAQLAQACVRTGRGDIADGLAKL